MTDRLETARRVLAEAEASAHRRRAADTSSGSDARPHRPGGRDDAPGSRRERGGDLAGGLDDAKIVGADDQRADDQGADKTADDMSAGADDMSAGADGKAAGDTGRPGVGDDAAREIVLRQLAMAPRSRAQLERTLAARGCAPDVARPVLDRLTEVGLVDDEAYAAVLVRARRRDRGLARAALAHELAAAGVQQDVADAALAEVDPADEERTARALVDKRLRSLHGLGRQVQMRRLGAMLARKGYSASLAYTVVGDALAQAPEHRPD